MINLLFKFNLKKIMFSIYFCKLLMYALNLNRNKNNNLKIFKFSLFHKKRFNFCSTQQDCIKTVLPIE